MKRIQVIVVACILSALTFIPFQGCYAFANQHSQESSCMQQKPERLGRVEIQQSFSKVKSQSYSSAEIKELVSESSLSQVYVGYRGNLNGTAFTILVVSLDSSHGYIAGIPADGPIKIAPWKSDTKLSSEFLASVTPSKDSSRMVRTQSEDCSPGYVPVCIQYDLSCLKQISPGWLETACGFLPGTPAKIACFVAALYGKAQNCCTLHGCRADQG